MKTRISSKRMIGVLLAASCGFSALAHDDNPAQLPTASSVAPTTPSALMDAPVRRGTPEFPPPEAAQPLVTASAEGDRVTLSPWATEIANLAQAGMDESVMLAYVNSAGTFSLSSQHIIYLRNIGVPPEVLVAMMQHDAGLVSGARPANIAVVPPPPTFHFTFIPAAVVATAVTAKAEASATPPADVTILAAASPPDVAAPEVVQPEIVDPAPSLTVSRLPSATALEAKQVSYTYPVREPYPVKLSDPIQVIRAPNLRPNVIVIAPLR